MGYSGSFDRRSILVAQEKVIMSVIGARDCKTVLGDKGAIIGRYCRMMPNTERDYGQPKIPDVVYQPQVCPPLCGPGKGTPQQPTAPPAQQAPAPEMGTNNPPNFMSQEIFGVPIWMVLVAGGIYFAVKR